MPIPKSPAADTNTAKRLIADYIHAMVAVSLLAGAAAAPASDASAPNAAYPHKPITIIVTFPPGGGTDLLARKLGQALEEELGQPVVVDNRPGASGNIGASLVAHAAPDGYTLLMVNSSFAITPHVLGTPDFDAGQDFRAVINVGFIPSVVVTSAASRLRHLADWLAVSDSPGGAGESRFFASCGAGTPQHLAGAMMQAYQPVTLQQVPYKGCGPALVDVLSGQIPVGIVTASSAMPYIASGRLLALAVTSPKRAEQWPEVPTVAENGMPGYAMDQWHGLLAPADTPPAIINRLNAVLQQALARQSKQTELRQLGYTPTSGPDASPQAFQQLLQQDLERFAETARKLAAP